VAGGGDEDDLLRWEAPKRVLDRLRCVATARIEKECADRTRQRCDVITLYQGAQYQLHTYKKYTDVRLVFAPEEQTAFFGGDPDNFTFPRHDLDICIVRAYENGVPAKPPAGGTLRHKGWRASKVDLPALPARQDAAIIAPAEIEIE